MPALLLDHDRATLELLPDYHRLRTYAQELTDHTPATGSLSTSKGPQTTTPSSTAGQLQHQLGLSDTAGLAAINFNKFSSTSQSIASSAATNAICSRFLVSHALRYLIVLNHACAFSPQVKSPRAETEKPWWGLTINKMATQQFFKAGIAFHSAPRTKTPCRSSRRFLFSHEVFANPVSNHASRPLMQVKSLRAEAAQSCSTQLPLHELLKDDDKQREMSLAISYKMSSLAISYKMSRVNPDSR